MAQPPATRRTPRPERIDLGSVESRRIWRFLTSPCEAGLADPAHSAVNAEIDRWAGRADRSEASHAERGRRG